MDVWPGRLQPSHHELRARAAEVEGILSLLTDPIDRELIDSSSRLRAISNYAVGCDNVDLHAASGRGIPVGHTPDVLTETTADFTVGLMLALARRVVEGEAAVRRGEWLTWEPAFLLGRDLHEATVGIVGYGRIGRAVADRLRGFRCRILHTTRSDGVPLEELLESSDLLSLHCPLTPQTHHLIDAPALGRMKQSALLVNTSRGAIVDTLALAHSLRAGHIAGAALDVTDPEPLPARHPLTRCPNLLLTPHIASASHATREAMAEMAVDNLLAGLAGERMPHCANPQVYSS